MVDAASTPDNGLFLLPEIEVTIVHKLSFPIDFCLLCHKFLQCLAGLQQIT